jgi:hypothetical protein
MPKVTVFCGSCSLPAVTVGAVVPIPPDRPGRCWTAEGEPACRGCATMLANAYFDLRVRRWHRSRHSHHPPGSVRVSRHA